VATDDSTKSDVLHLIYNYVSSVVSMAARYPSTAETTNYARLSRLVVDVCADALRHLLNKQLSPIQLGVEITNNKQLLWPRLNPDQRQQFYPPPGTLPLIQPSQFDISLIYILLRNITKLPQPSNGWGKPPPSIAPGQPLTDEVERIRTCRNTIYGHVANTAVSNADFIRHWADIAAVLGHLDQAWGTQFHRDAQLLKVECMDPGMEQRYMGQFHALCLSDKQTEQDLQATKQDLQATTQDLQAIKQDHQTTKHDLQATKQNLRATKQNLQTIQGHVNTLSQSDQERKQDLQAVQGQVNTLSLSDHQTKQDLHAVHGTYSVTVCIIFN
jgi:hypothetical protein